MDELAHGKENRVAEQKISGNKENDRGSHFGRPPLQLGRARSERVVSFVTPAELEALRALANRRGLSVSAVIYGVLRTSLDAKE